MSQLSKTTEKAIEITGEILDTPGVKTEDDEVLICAIADRIEALIKPQEEILELIRQYGGRDGEHHKQWVLNEIIKILVGEDNHEQWVADYECGDSGPGTYHWDRGIAP